MNPADTLRVHQEAVLEALVDEENPEAGEDIMANLAERLDLNRVSRDELGSIPGISRSAVETVIAWRDSLGHFDSMAIIDTSASIRAEDRMLLRAFTVVSKPGAVRRSPARVTITSRLSRRLERSRGYLGDAEERPYPGSPMRIHHRIRISAGQVRSAVTLDKPSGAAWRWEPADQHFGYDVVRGHVSLRPAGGFQIVAGDFRADFGQGLTIWSGSVFGRGRETVRAVQRPPGGIRGSAGMLDARLLRGLGISSSPIGPLRMYGFASRRRIDAAIDTTEIDGSMMVSARRVASTHRRTALELSRRRTLSEQLVGAAAIARTGLFEVGIVGFRAQYDVPLSGGDRPDTMFDPGGHAVSGMSLFGQIHHRGLTLATEVDLRYGPGHMTTSLVVRRPGDSEFVVHRRRLSRNAHNPFSAGFASQPSSLRNEEGWYLGMRAPVLANGEIRGYVDIVRYPWLRYQVSRPTTGSDFLLEWRQRPRPWWVYYVTLRRRSVESGLTPQGAILQELVRHPRSSIRLHSELSPTTGLRVLSRVEMTSTGVQEGKAWGYAIYQEMQTSSVRGTSAAFRIVHFDVETFDVRIYAYERDVSGAFSSHMHTGRGRRAYFFLAKRLSQNVYVQGRISRTWFDDVDTIGSGHDAISGNRATDVRLQLIIRNQPSSNE
jgi:hypothetical protein